MIPLLLRGLPVAALLVMLARAATAAELVDDDAITRWIDRHAHIAKGIELPHTRFAVSGDVDGDGRADAAVIYVLDGGSRRRQTKYLAVFRRGAGGLRYAAHVLVGREGLRDVTRATILGGMIELEVLEYRPADAMCCPSRLARRKYRLSGSKLAPVRAP